MRKLTRALAVGVWYAMAKQHAKQVIIPLLCVALNFNLHSQCLAPSGTIEGNVFVDNNGDGLWNGTEPGQGNVLVSFYDADDDLITQVITDFNGSYTAEGLSDGESYRAEFSLTGSLTSGMLSPDNGSLVQFMQAPNCDISIGVLGSFIVCSETPIITITCFVRGQEGENDDVETIVGLRSNFNADSPVSKYAMKSETGSIWGLGYHDVSDQLVSSSFVKQYAGLTSHGHGAIFKTSASEGVGSTELLVNLADRGINVGPLSVTDVYDCDYGTQVGKIGLGSLVLDDTQENLYTVNLFGKSLVKIEINSDLESTNITEISIPNPGCEGGVARPFALKYYEGKLYVGVTCTAEFSLNDDDSSLNVYEYDPATGSFDLLLTDDYLKGYWFDQPSNEIHKIMHWLTDIDFTKEGHMILGLSDRIGHRYCNEGTGRLDQQYPDIVMAWNDDGEWKLEYNGRVADLVGVGADKDAGPDGEGEFYGHDYWVPDEDYHPEVALGSFYVHPGSNYVIASVYDPLLDTYSGGLHRYSNRTGEKVDAIELYTRTTDPLFGKATGFGDLIAVCDAAPIEIGNLVWHDVNLDGVQTPGEHPIPGAELILYDDQCNLVGRTISDINGVYAFNSSNVDLDGDGVFDGLNPNSTYFIYLDKSQYNSETLSFVYEGEDYIMSKKNAGSGLMAAENDFNGVQGYVPNCPDLGDAVFMEVNTGNLGANDHSYDMGMCKPFGFDLALYKILDGNPYVTIGDTVSFSIFVFNQGHMIAKEYVIADYIQEGYKFLPDLNPSWKYDDGIAKTRIDDTFFEGEMDELKIYLEVTPSSSREWVNIAEISSSTDQFNGTDTDIDSTPDSDVGNDTGGIPNSPLTDNVIDDDGTIDEDDHDPARLFVKDIALRKVVVDDRAYGPGDDVEFDIFLFNQGTERIHNIEIAEHLPFDMFMDLAKNSGWELDPSGIYMYKSSDVLEIGDVDTVSVVTTLKNTLSGDEIINIAEVARAEAVNDPNMPDFDSTPDMDMTNDKGGEVNTTTDDEIEDAGLIDEDDHDPALVTLGNFDLALRKRVVGNNVVKLGDIVQFSIEIFNQGTMIAGQFTISDHFPSALTFMDDLNPGWKVDGNIAKYRVDEDLNPQEETVIYIYFRIDEYKREHINVAEISAALDENMDPVTDKDSTPDEDPANDNGTLYTSPATDDVIDGNGVIDEDDNDGAMVMMLESGISQECICLGGGRFQDEITINGPEGENWYIHSVTGMTDDTDTPFVTGPAGYTLADIPLGGGRSDYILTGNHEDGQGYSILLTAGNGVFELFENTCYYEHPAIEGELSVCILTSNESEYSTDDEGGCTYAWSILEAGPTILSPTDEAELTVDWTTAANGEYTVVMTKVCPDRCITPVEAVVTAGNVSGALSCIGELNISLGQNCTTVVTPAMMMVGDPTPGAAYSVILMDPDGNVIPNATLTKEHIGMQVSAKVMDGCSGNSCWGYVYAEDKMPPTVLCEDITLSCNDMLVYPGPLYVDNCGGPVDVSYISEILTPLQCDPDYVKIIERTYIGVDEWGNVSPECDQVIYVRRINFDDIIYPDSFLMAQSMALECGSFGLDENGNPHPDFTGVPTLDGLPLYPTFAFYCNTTVGYYDLVLDVSSCVTKIMRTWVVYEASCPTDVFEEVVQIIEIADTVDPTFDCPDDITAATSGATCTATVLLPPVSPEDDCSDEFHVDIAYPGGFLQNQNGAVIQLPFGLHQVTYTVYDQCYNSSSCTIDVEVIDDTAPVVVCDVHTVVGLTLDGVADVYASTFDDGSFDDCQLDRLVVMRMDGGVPCGLNNFTFGEHVTFCCADVGNTIMVRLRAYDAADNYNECMVEVVAQDKFPPIISCPGPVQIDCGYNYNLDDLTEFGEASATDACPVIVVELDPVENVTQCGVGEIIRTFMASDANGNVTCTQTITITNPAQFTCSDINWPDDYAPINGSCLPDDLEPEDLPFGFDYPVISEDGCDLVGMTYEDDYYPIVGANNACFKILRNWTVIDWCQIDDPSYTPCTWSQIIKISNLIAPIVDSICSPLSVCTFDVDCEGGYIDLVMTAGDDCTPDELIRWEYEIDIDSDGIIDYSNFGLGHVIIASGTYPIGDHTILYTFEDGCGNKTSCLREFSIVNCKSPTAICIDGLSVGLVPMDLDGDGDIDTEMACITPDMIDLKSEHLCGYEIDLSFSVDVDDDLLCFDCFDIGEQTVTLWVTDIHGGTSICEVTVVVQDNNDVDGCPNLKDCIDWVLPELDIAECTTDFTPDALGSEVTVSDTCFCQDYTIDYDDVILTYPNATCTIIERTWTVEFECLTGAITCDSLQIINVLNNAAPAIICPADLTVTTGLGNTTCLVDVDVDLPDVNEDCSTDVIVTNDSPFANSNSGDADGTYPLGTTLVTYTATNDCGLSSTCSFTITVEDDTAPTCLTQDITVALGANNEITITGAQVDDGSFDNCTAVDLEVDPDTFGCDEVGENGVVLTVTDQAGNSTTCTATVTVLDNSMPVCMAQDITLQLDENGDVFIDADDIDNGSSAGCNSTVTVTVDIDEFHCNDIGEVVVTLTVTADNGMTAECTAVVTVADNIPPSITCPADMTVACDANTDDLTQFGSASATDNCQTNVVINEIITMNINECGAGLIIRTFTAGDENGNTTQCSQLIFVGSPDDLLVESDITWPISPVVLYDCVDLHPDSLMSTPNVVPPNPNCANISINYEDINLNEDNVCQDSLQRTWTVIDSCQLDDDGFGTFTFDQLIVVNDTLAPIITLPDTVYVECVTQLNYVVDVEDCNLLSVTNNSPFASDNNSADISGVYPDDTIVVTIVAMDRCGLVSTDSVVVAASGVDNTPPRFECKKVQVDMPPSGMITIPATDFICLPMDNCTDSIDLAQVYVGAWTEEGNEPLGDTSSFMTFDCTFLENTVIYVGVVDQAGNFTRCISLLTIFDPNMVCGPSNEGIVSGTVETEEGLAVENVEVNLSGSPFDTEMTDEAGEYAFPVMPTGGSYAVNPYKDDDHINGVSTLDLLLIQKHVLGIKPLDSPYKLIAADVNASGSVTGIDLLELRKLLLGVYLEFPNNTSWRMVDAGYEFPVLDDPFAEQFPEEYDIDPFSNSMNVEFVGVKIGDVDNSNIPSLKDGDGVEARSGNMSWDAVVNYRRDGEIAEVIVSSIDDRLLDGFQFTIDFNEMNGPWKVWKAHRWICQIRISIHSVKNLV